MDVIQRAKQLALEQLRSYRQQQQEHHAAHYGPRAEEVKAAYRTALDAPTLEALQERYQEFVAQYGEERWKEQSKQLLREVVQR